MNSIGVRELRQHASRWLARVRAGETFVVTDRGRAVAQLGPLPERTGYDALVADGSLVPGSGRGIDDILHDLDLRVPDDGGRPLSEALAELREDER